MPRLERDRVRKGAAFSFEVGECSSLVEELSADDFGSEIVRETKLARTFRHRQAVDRVAVLSVVGISEE